MRNSSTPGTDPGLVMLSSYGWDRYHAVAPALPKIDGMPARILAQHRGSFEILAEHGLIKALVGARLRRSTEPNDHAVVGDWIVATQAPNSEVARIERVLPRTSAFTRANPGTGRGAQVLAANIDTVFIVDTLDKALNLRRIERYMVVAWESGAQPVLALSKADQCEDVASAIEAAKTVAGGASVHAYSAVTGFGIDALTAHLDVGHTATMIGPSGVGKSTLINSFCGESVQQVGDIREFDGKGRHTTTGRQLLKASSGALFIDTPGLRELQLWEVEDGLQRMFGDIDELAANCRFSNCGHTHEPGCAVRAAVESGELAADRLASYEKLDRETAVDEARRDKRAASEALRDVKVATRAFEAEARKRLNH